MRFHCQTCGKDFTTLSKEINKRHFVNLDLRNMRCPHCSACNQEQNLKPLKKTRHRYQPKRRSADTDEIYQPIVLSDICRSRMCCSFGNQIKFEVVCDGCPSAFNCLSGNVDDGVLEDLAEEKKVVRKQEVEVAKVKVVDKIVEDNKAKFIQVKASLGKMGWDYEMHANRLKCGGTIWKLDNEDRQAIVDGSWHTPKTIVIKNTFRNKGIDLSLAQELFRLGNILGA